MQCSTRYLLPCTLLPQILKTPPTYSPSTSPEQYSQTQLPPLTIRKMSTRRSPRSRPHPNDTRITDDQISDLVSSLQRLIPELRHPRSEKVPASRVLQETCNYIRSLHREVDDLSDRLALLLGSDGADSDQADLIRSMLMF